MSVWTKDCQRSLAEMTSLSSRLFEPRVCPLRQPAMSPTYVATSMNKMKNFLGLVWGWFQTFFPSEGTLLLVRLGLVRVVSKFETASCELNNIQWPDDVEALWGDERLVRVLLFMLRPGTRLYWAYKVEGANSIPHLKYSAYMWPYTYVALYTAPAHRTTPSKKIACWIESVIVSSCQNKLI